MPRNASVRGRIPEGSHLHPGRIEADVTREGIASQALLVSGDVVALAPLAATSQPTRHAA